MKTYIKLIMVFALLGPSALPLLADGGTIGVRVSIKVIQSSTGADPTNGLTGPATVDTRIAEEVERGNQTLIRTHRGYRLVLLPIQRVQPPAPNGSPADYWFTLEARENRTAVENAAEADKKNLEMGQQRHQHRFQ